MSCTHKVMSRINFIRSIFATDIWKALLDIIVESSSLKCFKRLLDRVDLAKYYFFPSLK